MGDNLVPNGLSMVCKVSDRPVPKRFGNDDCLDIIRPLTATTGSREHFDPLKPVGGCD
jgi:hypothetical protein